MKITAPLSKAICFILSLLVISLAAYATTHTNDETLTDADLIRAVEQMVSAPMNGEQQWVIGYHHGTEVIRSFQCADLCPENTLRIIYYNVPDVEGCANIGGVSKQILTPIDIRTAPRQFCFPKAIADNWESYLK